MGWGPLINTGSWIHEPAFLGREPKDSPYWPGHVVIVPPNTPHKFVNSGDGRLKQVSIHPAPEV